MANQEQVELLKQGVDPWNEWRNSNPHMDINLSSANLSKIDLQGINFSGNKFRYTNLNKSDFRSAILSDADLSWATLMGATLEFTDLRNARLIEADLGKASLLGSILIEAKLHNAVLIEAELVLANLTGSDLTDAKLSDVRLWQANMTDANCHRANFYRADISGADFTRANLSHTNLTLSTAVRANFTGADLTGACIEDWNINDKTIFDNVVCNYIYLKGDCQERRPIKGRFEPGEFATLIKKVFQTIDLVFTDGINWQAFFQTFQELQEQDGEILLQGIERKDTEFVIHLESSIYADKAAIETQAKARYKVLLKRLESQYKQQLLSEGSNLEVDDIKALLAGERQRSAQLLNILETMAKNQIPNQTIIYGNVGIQNSGSGNIKNFTQNISSNRDEIGRLIKSLREAAQSFPTEQQENVLDELDTLEAELVKPDKCDPKRLGRRLRRIAAAGTAALAISGSAMTDAVDLSANVNEFTKNVQELADKLGIGLVQPGDSEQSSSS